MKIKVIAEIGWNHQGDMNLAKQMIKAAQESGADYAKFQTWSVSRLKPGEWDLDGRRQIYEKAELTKENHIELINYCNEVGIEFLSSAFSIQDAQLLVDLGVKAIKVPSFESRNHSLISFCDNNFKTVFMSTGTSTFEEIKESSKLINQAKWYILHCVSTYPCFPEQANIQRMNKLKELGFSVGYSDHIQDIESAKVAIGEGAEVIEKHFTLDNNLPGRDNKFAILPQHLKNLSEFINLREKMFIYHGDDFQPSELDSRNNYTGRWDG